LQRLEDVLSAWNKPGIGVEVLASEREREREIFLQGKEAKGD
jgi:hypothetical protein